MGPGGGGRMMERIGFSIDFCPIIIIIIIIKNIRVNTWCLRTIYIVINNNCSSLCWKTQIGFAGYSLLGLFSTADTPRTTSKHSGWTRFSNVRYETKKTCPSSLTWCAKRYDHSYGICVLFKLRFTLRRIIPTDVARQKAQHSSQLKNRT